MRDLLTAQPLRKLGPLKHSLAARGDGSSFSGPLMAEAMRISNHPLCGGAAYKVYIARRLSLKSPHQLHISYVFAHMLVINMLAR